MLYNRIINEGTIAEPGGKPDPRFALPSTVNWMHALSILVGEEAVDFGSAVAFYVDEGKRSMTRRTENTVLEKLFLALHHLSAFEPRLSDAVGVHRNAAEGSISEGHPQLACGPKKSGGSDPLSDDRRFF